jgi:hypothetical protein
MKIKKEVNQTPENRMKIRKHLIMNGDNNKVNIKITIEIILIETINIAEIEITLKALIHLIKTETIMVLTMIIINEIMKSITKKPEMKKTKEVGGIGETETTTIINLGDTKIINLEVTKVATGTIKGVGIINGIKVKKTSTIMKEIIKMIDGIEDNLEVVEEGVMEEKVFIGTITLELMVQVTTINLIIRTMRMLNKKIIFQIRTTFLLLQSFQIQNSIDQFCMNLKSLIIHHYFI